MPSVMKGFSFSNSVLLINDVVITGWPEGDDAIDVKRRTESATMKVGCGGDGVVSLSADRSGEITFKLKATSSSNAYLNSLLAQQENRAGGFTPISVLFQDFMLKDLAPASQGFINGPPRGNRGAGDHEWTIVVASTPL